MRHPFQAWCGSGVALMMAGWGIVAGTAGPWTVGSAVTEIRLQLEEAAQESLRQNPRQDVVATVVLDGVRWEQVHVHLKGSTGSFRPLDDRPSWTVDLDDRKAGRRFRGTSKFHLNNAAEDPSYFSEWLGHAVFARAGIPTPDVSHAVVWLGDRRLGLYVMKEGFTDEFLQRHWPQPGWRLFEPVQGADVDGSMVRRAGAGNPEFPKVTWDEFPNREIASAESWTNRLDRLAFLRFQAAEVLLAHRDGYTLARNNYRVLVEPGTDRLHWLPHGLDQVLQPVDLPWNPVPAGTMARRLWDQSDTAASYAAMVRQVFADVFEGPSLSAALDLAAERVLSAITAREAAEVRIGLADLQSRLRAREQFLRTQTFQVEPAVEFLRGPVAVTGWQLHQLGSGGAGAKTECSEFGPVLTLRAGGTGVISWRSTVVLAAGRYRWVGQVRNTELEPLAVGRNQGVALRVSGDRPRASGGTKASEWRSLAVEFDVQEPRKSVLLNCELRALAGSADFALASLRLEKLP